jgi:hypothetical protein
MQFFVDPTAVETIFPWGEKQPYVVVKKFLTAKEEQMVRAAGIPHMLAKSDDAKAVKAAKAAAAEGQEVEGREMKMGLDMGRMKLVRASAYIVSWGVMLRGKPVEPNEQTIGNLLPHVFDALDAALDAHKEKMDAEKKSESGEITQISASA